MTAVVLCLLVVKDKFIPTAMIKRCNHCKKDIWVFYGSLLDASGEESILVFCPKCFLIFKAGAYALMKTGKIRKLVERINASVDAENKA